MSELAREVRPKPPPHLVDAPRGSYSITEDDLRRSKVVHLELEQFNYHTRGAYDALLSLELQGREMLASVPIPAPEQLANRVFVQQLPEAMTLSASWTVDRLLDSIRKGQNSLIPYLGRTFKRSYPSSFADIAKSCANGTARLPEDLKELITDYWAQSGKRLKDYRDFALHHAVVASDARVAFLPDGRSGLFLAMVSNPERKSLRDMVFNSPYVPALPYSRQVFLEFYGFTYAFFYLLARRIGYPQTITATFGFKDPLTNSLEGYVIIPTTGVDEELWSIREGLKPQLEELFGKLDDPTLSRTAG